MTKQISEHASAAKMIRKELKAHGIKASVRASTGSMTSSINVDIKQDILPATLEAIKSFTNKFQMGNFNGMEDIYEYSNTNKDLPQVKFVFVSVEYSDEIKAEVADYIGNMRGLNGNMEQYRHMALNGSWGDFWNGKKPTIKLSLAS